MVRLVVLHLVERSKNSKVGINDEQYRQDKSKEHHDLEGVSKVHPSNKITRSITYIDQVNCSTQIWDHLLELETNVEGREKSKSPDGNDQVDDSSICKPTL